MLVVFKMRCWCFFLTLKKKKKKKTPVLKIKQQLLKAPIMRGIKDTSNPRQNGGLGRTDRCSRLWEP
jgi:hypothetical protein